MNSSFLKRNLYVDELLRDFQTPTCAELKDYYSHCSTYQRNICRVAFGPIHHAFHGTDQPSRSRYLLQDLFELLLDVTQTTLHRIILVEQWITTDAAQGHKTRTASKDSYSPNPVRWPLRARSETIPCNDIPGKKGPSPVKNYAAKHRS